MLSDVRVYRVFLEITSQGLIVHQLLTTIPPFYHKERAQEKVDALNKTKRPKNQWYIYKEV